MITFENDYSYGCHPKVLKHLAETNMEMEIGYGFDRYTQIAADKIKTACGLSDAEVFFISGGTQTNQLVLDALLPVWAGAVSCKTGHIGSHEAGAVEFTGHKVLELPAHDGKLDTAELDSYMENLQINNGYGQLVVPGAVYISYPTEFGTLYSRNELVSIRNVCDKWELPLYADGARLAYGLASPECDITLKEFASLCDVFYIGGTKVGALCGEAVVFKKHALPAHFISTIKQHGAMLAKGRVLSVQFDALFTDDLYMEMGRHAIQMAILLKECLLKHGYRLDPPSPTNQQFAVLTPAQYDAISKEMRVCFWDYTDDGNYTVRFCTSWATTEEEIRQLDLLLGKIDF